MAFTISSRARAMWLKADSLGMIPRESDSYKYLSGYLFLRIILESLLAGARFCSRSSVLNSTHKKLPGSLDGLAVHAASALS